MIFGISAFYCYARETTAIIERILANARYTIGDSYTRETTAIPERTSANARYAVSDCYTRETTAIVERIRFNARSSGNYHSFKRRWNTRRIIRIRLRSEYMSKMHIACSVFSCSYKRYRYARETTATVERIRANALYTIGDSYTRETTAIVERIIANARYAVSDCYTREITAIVERIIANARYAVSDCYTRETTATAERMRFNARSSGNFYSFKRRWNIH